MADLKQLVLGRKDVSDLSDVEQELPPDLMTVNMGPSHPAMHGTVRIVLTVDGERIVAGDVQPGYLHRCFEKESEHATYTQVFPYTDRLNYVSPMINNVGWAMTIEKLLGLTDKLPKRVEYIRVIVSEMSRITDHLTCVSASAMELGAFTAFLYFLKAREWDYELLEKVSGARLTHSYVRVGGVSKDLPADFDADLTLCLDKITSVMVEVEAMLNNNKIFRDRMAGVGAQTRENAIATGCAGPIARACGVDYDVRRDFPYSVYPELEFDVPLGTTGDCYDRYLVRIEEMKQSIRILRPFLNQIPEGPPIAPDHPVSPPPGQPPQQGSPLRGPERYRRRAAPVFSCRDRGDGHRTGSPAEFAFRGDPGQHRRGRGPSTADAGLLSGHLLELKRADGRAAETVHDSGLPAVCKCRAVEHDVVWGLQSCVRSLPD